MKKGKCHKYKINEIMWIGEDYTDGMKIEDIMRNYGLTENQVNYIVSKYKFHRKKCATDKKSLIRENQERKYAYMWALVTADEKELPVTPYYDTARELAEATGMKIGTLMSAKSRGIAPKYHTREGTIRVRVIKIDTE